MNIFKKTEINKKIKNTFYLIIGIILFISLWEILSLSINEPNIFPDFFRTVRNTYSILCDETIYFSILTSLGIALLGIVISFILGVIFGCISGFVKPFEKIFLPFVTFFKIVPTACIIIMLIIFSKSLLSYIIIVFLIVFPIIYENTLKGIKSIDQNIILSLRLEGIYKSNSIFKVIIPTISPFVGAGLASGIGIGLKVEIMSEILIGSDAFRGIGYLIYQVRAVTFNYIDIYSYVLITFFIFLILDLIIYFIKKYIFKN